MLCLYDRGDAMANATLTSQQVERLVLRSAQNDLHAAR
jgi:hypothetical protein